VQVLHFVVGIAKFPYNFFTVLAQQRAIL
jgi:hypothetical protein